MPSQNTGSKNSLLSGEYTFQELISEICNGIDLICVCKRNTVVVTDMETLYAERDYLEKKKVIDSENIKLWQIQDGSYELDINEYGFYNTVKVVYDKGVIIESDPDLVRVYGEVPDTHIMKNLNKSQAKSAAKAFLAANLRDFNEMTIKASIIHDGSLDIGDIVTIENPLTLNNEIKKLDNQDPMYYFIKGMSISWEGEGGPILNDLELSYAPESPEEKEVPEIGSNGYLPTNNSNKKSDEVDTENTITVNHKPSTNQAAKYYKYEKYKKTWKNYCPNCKKSGKLSDNPKGVPEGEITCKACDSDYDGTTGADKNGTYRSYLTDAHGRKNSKSKVDTKVGELSA